VSGTDPCTTAWLGVTCDVSNTIITGLDLSFSQLAGTLPVDMARLTGLTSLDLSYNSLAGSLPADWVGPTPAGGLSLLASLKLDHNSLTSTLPPEWSALSSLNTLGL
jgi:hypothetical protein